ncbi:MAG: sulfurtransferase, partial [Burkholderiales bacterium]|nr:sulfurtransferase [Burkholderiales bacterium]
MYTTLISAAQLQQCMTSGQPLVVFDCSFDLMTPHIGPEAFDSCHIVGARYANLNTDLSAHHPAQDGEAPASGGRHPLPARATFARWVASQGVAPNTQVVVYDRNGANYCGRLWWMLKWCGHEAVAALDGGLQAWQAMGGATRQGPADAAQAAEFALGTPLVRLVDTATVLANLRSTGQTVLDARGAPRYRGEVEPLDPIAG